ncbi:peptidoglycan-binding protein [Sinorhizobium sp. BG8]|uniref:peptidoglycan-binding protein n=1 Tax=Sinorhizobium sp. BG8 TaxID=2613773 RepID=UPI00193E6CD9|nr:peptidoglycan-binding protein [Sinorhizobium sp. BG8]QRM54129.1 peptidoglycan-binding protein [Sinorhizobium sp. BG8]
MNGSRQNPPRPVERASLDALNRTIEGLEARIEGLMASGREARALNQERYARPEQTRFDQQRSQPLREDPVSEIVQRQRVLDATRERTAAARLERRQAFERQALDRQAMERQPAAQQVPAPHASIAPGYPIAAARQDTAAEIAEALVNLRQELRKDISDGFDREMSALRAEIRGIRQAAERSVPAEDMRDDLQRIALSINQLAHQSDAAGARNLRAEFDELRSVLDALAREDSIRRMESRWNGVESRIATFDQTRDDELVALAYRLDELKVQINSASAVPAIRDLESKVNAVADAVEGLGRNLQPDDRRFAPRFDTLDDRLDEISRAIAVSGHAQAKAADAAMVQRLEHRIADLSDQFDMVVQRPEPETGLGVRLEALAARVEDLANEEAALRLEERLEQLSRHLEQATAPLASPEIASYLSDISRKIDALDQGSVNEDLATRLDYLARRIEGMEAPRANPFADTQFSMLEGRLSAIAERLDEASASPRDDGEALRGLEAQIANLSALISAPQSQNAAALPSEFEDRMASLEEYMATNDEYIIEAARHAAETVMEAYQRASLGGASPLASDMAAISALAEDLRALEDLTRSSEERTARTFDALHDTLVQIAGRLEQLDTARQPQFGLRESAPAMPRADVPPMREEAVAFGQREYPEASASHSSYEQPSWTAASHSVEEVQEFAADAPAEVEAAELSLAEPRQKKAAVKTGLIAGIAKRLVPGRREPEAEPERTQVVPTPSIDPVDEIAPEEANQLLEPGSGAPDVRRILERVRAGQNASSRTATQPGDAEKADFIAAARRAAKMAAEEAEAIQHVAPEKKPSGKDSGSALARHRRPILMAVGAVLLAVMAYPLVSTLAKGEKAPQQAILQQPTATGDKKADEPAAVSEKRPAVTEKAQADVSADVRMAAASKADTSGSNSNTISGPASGQTAAVAGTTDAASGAAQMTRPVAAIDSQATAGFEPLDSAGSEDVGAPADGDSETASIDPASAAKATIAIPSEIAPASLAKAAGEGDSLALFEIGVRYTDGNGVKSDNTEAAKWYGLSADRGFAPAQYRLANLLEKGQGVERDLVKAHALYAKAAEQGNVSAMHNLAVLLASGAGKDAPDMSGAAKWFQQAAERGVRDSQFNLAILYARGNGVTQDIEESYKWFAVAARDGDTDAAQKRDEVANAMKPEQLSSAKAKFDLWKPQAVDEKANSVMLPDEWVGAPTKTASVDMKRAIRNIQAILNNNGFYAGTPDGEMGKRTVLAIKAFQKSIGQPETGEIDDQLVRELLKRNKSEG